MGVTNQNQALTKVVVGPSDVHITSFGVYGQARANGNLKWVIFDSTNLTAPVYTSSLQAVTAAPGTFAANATWYDCPPMSFTLLANHSYAMGAISDQVGTNTFYWGSTYSAFGGGSTVNGGGLSLPFMQSLCNSGLVGGNFTNTPTLYTVNNSNRYQMAFHASVPEPATIAVLAAGCLGMAVRRYRSR